MHKIKISLSVFGALMIASLFVTHSYISIAALVAAALHELGHVAAARICSIRLTELRLGIFGAALRPADTLCSYGRERAMTAAGPLVNLISAGIALALPIGGEAVGMFVAASLFLGLLNLLPINELDGGRILSCLLSYRSPDAARRVCRAVSAVALVSLWMLSVYLMLRCATSLSLFVFSSSLFCRIFTSRKN